MVILGHVTCDYGDLTSGITECLTHGAVVHCIMLRPSVWNMRIRDEYYVLFFHSRLSASPSARKSSNEHKYAPTETVTQLCASE